MKKALFAALAAVILLSGCTGKSAEGPKIHEMEQEDEVTLSFVNSWGGADSNAGALQQIFDNFESKYPNIKIQNEATFGDDFLPKLKTDFATGNDPDVFGIWPGSDMEALIDAGKAADLTDIINSEPEWKDSFLNAWDYCTFDEKIYGLPVEIIYEALFINTDIFKKYEVNAPVTYEDFMVLVRLFASKGVVPIAYNYQAEGTYLYQNIVAQMGGLKDGGDIEIFKQGMEKMKELYDRRAFPEDAYLISNSQRNELFLDGEAAMIVQGSWFTRNIYEAGMVDKVDMVPFPVFDKENQEKYSLIYGLGCGTFFISQKAFDDPLKREAAILLLKELTSKEASAILTNESGFISNIDLSGTKNTYPSLYTKGMDLIANAEHLVPPMDSLIDRNNWENILVPGFADLYRYGNDKIDVIWDGMDE
jgi:raffinose/stachyose/melibiose transport system substrate-binding protein